MCDIKLTEYMSFDFDFYGAVAPRAMALVCLKSLDSTWQENLKPKEWFWVTPFMNAFTLATVIFFLKK